MLTIPARCSELNPVETIFLIVKRKLHHDALKIEITREDFGSFSGRCIHRSCLQNYPFHKKKKRPNI